MTEIVWMGEARPEFDDLVLKDVSDLKIRDTDNLITHLIEIGDLEDGPLIHVHGRDGKLYAEYVANPEWTTLKQEG